MNPSVQIARSVSARPLGDRLPLIGGLHRGSNLVLCAFDGNSTTELRT
jgi:hypothetical protein